MIVRSGLIYVSDDGLVCHKPEQAALFDVVQWQRNLSLSQGEVTALQAVWSALSQYPEITLAMVRKYQASLDDAEQQVRAMQTPKP